MGCWVQSFFDGSTRTLQRGVQGGVSGFPKKFYKDSIQGCGVWGAVVLGFGVPLMAPSRLLQGSS